MTALPFPGKRFERRLPWWRRLLNLITNNDPYARPDQGYQGQGYATQNQLSTVDGFRVGDVKWAVGSQASVVRDNPGWAIADGTASVVIDGVSYSPNLVGKFAIGADGITYLVGASGGGGQLHVTGITQPVFAAPVITQQPNVAAPVVSVQPGFDAPTGHGPHALASLEVASTPGSGNWVGAAASLGALATGLAHLNESGGKHQPQPLTRSTDATLTPTGNLTRTNDVALDPPVRTTNVAIADQTLPLPAYVALWPLLKVH